MTMINNNEELRSYAFEKSLREMDERVRLRKAKKTGHEEGKIEGKKEGNYLRQVKTAIEMMNDNIDLSIIMKYTELTLSQITEIKNNLSNYQMMVAEKKS